VTITTNAADVTFGTNIRPRPFAYRSPVAISRRRVTRTIRELALSLPEAYEDAPWGFPVFKVADNRLFALLPETDPAELTVKLSAEEREIAALHPWVRRASHVGRYGWVTATIEDADALATALEWLRESYYLKAPAKLRDAAFTT
jgi:predicted DNA-binding protein (MmcQ/YjbR family)